MFNNETGLLLPQYIGTRFSKDLKKRSSWQDGEGLATHSVSGTVLPGLIGLFPLTSPLWSHWHSSWSPLPQRNRRLPGKEHCKPQRVCRRASKICSDPLLVVSLRSKLMLQGVFPWGDVNSVCPLFLSSQWQTKIWFHRHLPWGTNEFIGLYLYNMSVRVWFGQLA